MRTSLSITAAGLLATAACLPPPAQVQYGPPPASTAGEAYTAGATGDEAYGGDAEAEPCDPYAEGEAYEPDEPYEAEAAAEPYAPAAGGSDLLTWLAGTGSWKTTNHQFVFDGQGGVRRSDAFVMTHDNSRGSYTPDCVSSQNELGTVRHEGEYLIMLFGANTTNYCGERSQQAAKTVRYHIEWHPNDYYEGPFFPGAGRLQLQLRDIDCTQGDMWCIDLMNPL